MAFASYAGQLLFGLAAARPTTPADGTTQTVNTSDSQTATALLDGFPIVYIAIDTGAISMWNPLTQAWVATGPFVAAAGVTFADLPAAPVAGQLATITDADSASYANGAAGAGGGGGTPALLLVMYNGAAWVAA